MVKKLGTLGVIMVAVCLASMAWAEVYGTIPAPQPMGVQASAPAPQPVAVPAGGKVCAPGGKAPLPAAPEKLTTTINVQMKYPRPVPPPPMMGGCGAGQRPPIPVAVPMWKFIVPWPPFVYYLPVQ
jgi:hypothetical protein